MAAKKLTKPNYGQSAKVGGNSGRRRYGSRAIKKTFKSPLECLQRVIFKYSASNKNKNVFVENVKKLS